jgi:DNA-binding MarR family transcriptional regulator
MKYALQDSLIHLLHRASQAADECFAGHAEISDLTARQFIVLATIAEKEGSSQTAISEVTGIDRSTLADVIGRLQRRGLVWRRRTKQDARAYAVRLTEAGHKVLAAALPAAAWVDSQLISSVSPAKRAEFIRQLRSLSLGSPMPRSAKRLLTA